VALAHNLPNSSLRFESVCDSRRSRQNKKALTASSHSTQHRSSKNISLHIAAGSSEFSRRGPLHPTPQTPHPKPYTLHPTPYTPTPYTLHTATRDDTWTHSSKKISLSLVAYSSGLFSGSEFPFLESNPDKKPPALPFLPCSQSCRLNGPTIPR
jgi:hypothetical protein